MILWLREMSSSQFEPRTENSTGNPRWAVRPCWERSWMTARMPGMAFSSRRRMFRQLGDAELALVAAGRG